MKFGILMLLLLFSSEERARARRTTTLPVECERRKSPPTVGEALEKGLLHGKGLKEDYFRKPGRIVGKQRRWPG